MSFKTQLLAFIYISFLVLTACSDRGREKIRGNEPVTLDDFELISDNSLSIDQLIPLETVAANLMGIDLRIKFADTLIFVLDESTKNGVHVFEISGAYINTLGKIGEGPGTIPSIEDFVVSENGELYILSTVGDNASVYRISLDGAIAKVFDVNYVATSFEILNDGQFFFYGGYNLPYVTHRIIRTDAKGIRKNELLENDYQNLMLPMSERNFFRNGTEIYFLESFNPEIYQILNDSIKPILRVNFRPYSIPKEFWKMDIMEGFQLINQNGFANFRSFFQKNKLMVSDVMIQKEGEVFKYILIQQDENKYKLRADRDNELLYYFPIGIDSQDRILFLTYKSIFENRVFDSFDSDPLNALTETDFDYPVIFFSKLSPVL